ncbi:pilus assembly protein TadG-related protein [Bradyrhizobium prioriisuperbiae]|uniref:pilus assembly protein TadG-related protein n=1 Tax=Bradyrhizobium prioriisuperbiae TaxID=2854389 RepID=UPI0028E3D058|nr:pilus assembly protein TadG-related protein [Bradyrhizobium prioritasuperba]
MRQLVRRFWSDRRGNIAMMSAASMMMVCGFAAFGVDIGSVFLDRRRVQSTADLAAIVAAGDLTNATAAAKATVMKNNYPADSLVSVEYGTYVADTSLSAQQRFTVTAGATPGAATNAVRVTVKSTTSLFFGKVLTGQDSYDVQATATATTTRMASFAIGSGLVSLNGGLLNQLLGSMLGTTLSLSVADYNALLNAKVDAFDFMKALATQLNVTAGTYEQLLTGQVKLSDLITSLLNAQRTANGNDAGTIAMSSVSQAVLALLTKISTQQLLDLGPYATLQVGEKPLVGVKVSVLDMLQAIAQIANGTNQIATGLNVNIPGIATVQLLATIGERPVGTSWMAVGTKGASVHTAQVRVLLTVQLLGSGAASVVNLPIYVEVASGTATLDNISCGYPDITTSSVTLGVTPGIVDAWIGNVSAADMKNFTTKPNPAPVNLVSILLIGLVSGSAHVSMGNTTPTAVTFSYADITANPPVKKTTNTSSFLSSLLTSLLGNLQVKVLFIPIPVPGILVSLIQAVTAPVDALLASVLQALGVSLGQATTWVNGIRCDGGVLVI